MEKKKERIREVLKKAHDYGWKHTAKVAGGYLEVDIAEHAANEATLLPLEFDKMVEEILSIMEEEEIHIAHCDNYRFSIEDDTTKCKQLKYFKATAQKASERLTWRTWMNQRNKTGFVCNHYLPKEK